MSLPWDFRTTFPQPTEQAVEAGRVQPEDITVEGIGAIHDEHAREMMVVLMELDHVRDSQYRGVHPWNGKTPTKEKDIERLRQFFEAEPARLRRWFDNLMGVYADVFGVDAADAFRKAVEARHAGVEVVCANHQPPSPSAEPQPQSDPTLPKAPERLWAATAQPAKRPSRGPSARFPVPTPLTEAVAAGRFGVDEEGKRIRPGRDEVCEITASHADKLIDLIHAVPANADAIAAALAAYAEDFGAKAAEQLGAYARRQASRGERAEIPTPRTLL